MLDGQYVGVKNVKHQPVLIEQLFEDNIIQFWRLSSDITARGIDIQHISTVINFGFICLIQLFLFFFLKWC